MTEEFNCNCCGVLTDTGYFYCEKCHRTIKEKEQKRKEEESQVAVTEQKENN